MKYVSDHTASANNQVSRFKNLFFDKFWKNMPLELKMIIAKDSEAYFRTNRALSDTIDSLVLNVGASYNLERTHREELKKFGHEKQTQIIESHLTSIVVKEILKSNRIIAYQFENPIYGNCEFTLELPIITLENAP